MGGGVDIGVWDQTEMNPGTAVIGDDRSRKYYFIPFSIV